MMLVLNKLIQTNERGQSLTELSIAMAMMLILLAGVADLGRAFFTYIALRDAAQEGALYGSFAFSEPDPLVPANGLIDPGEACERIFTRVRQNSDTPVNLAIDADIQVQIAQSTNPTIWVACSSAIAIQPCAYDRIRVSVMVEDFTIATPFLGSLVGQQSVDITAFVEDSLLAPTHNQTSACP